MPRVARGLADSAVYHVVNRGNGRATVFHNPGDYAAFVSLIGEAKQRYPLQVLAYCLMPNHFHLLVKPECGADLSKWMQWLMTTHVRRYHRHYGTSGHVWQGRFKSFSVQRDEHLLTVMRYVEGNPVRAGLVVSAADWPWSSHLENLGTGSADTAVPVPGEERQQATAQAGTGTAGAEPVPAESVPVVDRGMIELPSGWTTFVDTPISGRELNRLKLSIHRRVPFAG